MSTEPLGPCVLGTGPRNSWGYVQVRLPGSPKQYAAHRLAWQLAYGPIPPGMCVCHHCDNPACINVKHLWLGTNLDNVADRVAKGRSRGPRGEASSGAKLTTAQVHAIRAALAAGERPRAVAARFGVCVKSIFNIKHGHRWGWLPEEPPPERNDPPPGDEGSSPQNPTSRIQVELTTPPSAPTAEADPVAVPELDGCAT